MLHPVILSPPFGSRFNPSWATSVAGSFTADPRPGLVPKVLKTLRPVSGGWVNAIGLRNPGIRNIKFDGSKIYSVAALKEEDYDVFYDTIPPDIMVELNLSCPNVHSRPVLGDFHSFVKKYPFVSVKLPPPCVNHAYRWAHRAYKQGVRWFHLCNTIPTDRGGESGLRLKDESIKMIRWIREFMPDDIKIIGGGGIYSPADVQEYRAAGANIFSVSTVCFTPWRIGSIVREASK